MTDEQRDEIRLMQARAQEIASAATKADIEQDVSDMVYIVIAVRQHSDDTFVLGSYISHTTAMVLVPKAARKILETALATIGHEIPS